MAPRKDRRRPARPGNRGFVLVAVIWISGLLAAFAIAVSVSVRSHALFLRNDMALVRAQGIADGLLRLTALAAANPAAKMQADGSWRACRWSADAVAWVALQDQSGLVDLNTAAPPLMLALLEGLGLPHAQAEDLATAIRDYRDQDHVSDLGGSEAQTYPGRDFGPKNAPFEAVEELDQVPGMTPALLASLSPLTTVHTQQPGFNFATAPEALLQHLKLERSSAAGLPFASAAASPVRAVVVAAALADGTRVVRRAMIDITGQPQRPFAVLSWDTGSWPDLPGGDAPAAACLPGGS